MKEQIEIDQADEAQGSKTGWFEHGDSRIYYEDYGAGDPVLLLPGFAGSVAELAALRQALTMANYRVITADLPGSGRSQPQPRQYSAAFFEDDARAFTALLQHLSVTSAHLIGFSDGGEVSLLIAALMPDLARSVTTWGSAGFLSDPEGHLRGAMYNVIDDPIPPLQPFRDYLIVAYGESNARATTRNWVDAVSAIIDAGGDISRSKADKIACPALLITGEHDVFAPPELVSQLAQRIPAVKTLTAEGVGHDIHNAKPDWLAQTILDWLQTR
jgi:valacyclovir hydrolase